MNKEGKDFCEQLNILRLQKIPNHFYKEEQVNLTTYKTLKDWRIGGGWGSGEWGGVEEEEGGEEERILTADMIKF